MKIKISEVWNGGTDKVLELAIIETKNNPQKAVWDWIEKNRPDLSLCTSITGHGFHAVCID